MNSTAPSSEPSLEHKKEQFSPLLIANWLPHRPKEKLTEFLKKIGPSAGSSVNPFHLAVPFSWVVDATQLTQGKNIRVGSNAMCPVTPGCFTEKSSLQLLDDYRTQFVFVKPLPEDTENTVLKLHALLQKELPVFFLAEETPEVPIEGLLSALFQPLLQGESPPSLNNFTLVYSPSRIGENGLKGLHDNIVSSHGTLLEALEKAAGEHFAKEIKTAFAFPLIFEDCVPYMQDTPYTAFCFSDASRQQEQLILTLESLAH